MNYAFSVNNDIYLLGTDVEKPDRFNQLKPFIEHCCTVYGYF